MNKTIQARLDADAEAALSALVKRLGVSPSEVVRRAVKHLATQTGTSPRRKVIGLGQFDSGVPDLGSNPHHLRGFGRGH
ncbi:MAG: CopG family transcriptional regulator [Terriglobales bacterium]